MMVRWKDNDGIILDFLANGYTYQAIAAELGCTENAVKGAAWRLFEKLGAETKAHAVAIGYQRGILKISK